MKNIIPILLVFTLIFSACKKEIWVEDGEGLADWTTKTHNASTPNYSVVFDDSKVQRIDITIDKDWWKILGKHNSNYLTSNGGPGSFSSVTPIYVPCNIKRY